MVLARTTFQHETEARALAQRLVEAGLAACVHVQPVTSTYRWQGRIEEEPEWLVEARTDASRLRGLRQAMLAHHPYEVPLFEVVASQVSAEYADWARRS